MVKGKCVIFSAPSGSGKTTLVRHLLEQDLGLEFSISACTRAPRGEEKDGKDYYFLSLDEFKNRIEKEDFVEWEEVYSDHFYGTLKAEIERIWKNGKTVIFDVDVVGGLNLKKYFGKQALAIFVMPPDIPTLEKRLRGRGTDEEERIQKRLSKAKQELIVADQFDHIILNDDLEVAKQEAEKLVKQFI
ncbi:MAG: guanylate kinase [Vicingaceae bacterium]